MTDPMTDYIANVVYGAKVYEENHSHLPPTAEFCYISGLLGRIKELEQQRDAAVAVLKQAVNQWRRPTTTVVHEALAALGADTKKED